jgi:hypothetical protein
MSVYSPEYHAMLISPGPARTGLPAADKPAEPHESFFHHMLDVVNPLQHLPVIGTIYRAITGEHLDAFEKIAGDTLYGGLWGAVSSIADVAFEAITGKSFEDTALALFKSDDSQKVASTTVVAPSIAAVSLPSSDLPALPSVATNMTDGLGALSRALSAKGVDSDTASRAMYAYRRSMGLTAPVLAGIN